MVGGHGRPVAHALQWLAPLRSPPSLLSSHRGAILTSSLTSCSGRHHTCVRPRPSTCGTNAGAPQLSSSLSSHGYVASALIVRYGYYGKCRLALGPNSSLLMRTSSVFVERVQVQQEEERRSLQVYGFSERPELSPETHNWTVLNHLFVNAYNREGVSMWLNKGSRIYMSWQMPCGGRSCEGALVVLIKGKEQSKELQRYYASSLVDHGREAEYTITEDDVYYLGVVNPTPRIIALTMEVNVTSTVYDASKAVSACSASNSSCMLNLVFPATQYYVLATPDNVHLDVWTVEVYFVARLFTYFVLIGVCYMPNSVISIGIIVVIVVVILSRFGACDPEQNTEEQAAAESSETAPIVPRKDVTSIYGTNASDESRPADLCSSSSEDLYDGKICVICYDGRRDSYFIPCGHSATCLTCAQRIVQEENKICPICRRPIHKSKRLLIT